MEDLKFRTIELADFVQNASKLYSFHSRQVMVIGFSNGANTAASILLKSFQVVYYSEQWPFVPDNYTYPIYQVCIILISAGRYDTKELEIMYQFSGIILDMN